MRRRYSPGPRLWRSRLARALFLVWIATLGPILELRWVPPSTSAFMLRSEVLGGLKRGGARGVDYRWVDLREISPQLLLAVVAAEDQHFPAHWGFDLRALRSAWAHNRLSSRVRGGSTISQQTAKNLFLYPDRSYFRKALEAYFTACIEAIWSKRRILTVYVNIAEFGDGVFGAEAAARAFFHKPAQRLTAAEAALLAAVLPNPRLLNVRRPSRLVRMRAAWIRRQMDQLGGVGFLGGLD